MRFLPPSSLFSRLLSLIPSSLFMANDNVRDLRILEKEKQSGNAMRCECEVVARYVVAALRAFSCRVMHGQSCGGVDGVGDNIQNLKCRASAIYNTILTDGRSTQGTNNRQ
jgi:hypothetical protein